MEYANFDQLITCVTKYCRVKKAAVINPHDTATLMAVARCRKEGILSAALVGDEVKIKSILKAIGEDDSDYIIVDEPDSENVGYMGVRLIKEGCADFIMKGKIDTSVLLKSVVDKKSELRTGMLMSHLAFLEIPNYHKLVVLTDSGMVLSPGFEQKKQIIQNSVDTLHALDYNKPKIGILAAAEKVNPKVAATLEAAKLAQMSRNGEINYCDIDGPISYDVLMSRESAEAKGYSSVVAGDADIMVVPDMTSGNLLGKALLFSAKAKMAGIIVGAKVPIALTSRGAGVEEKYLSLVLAAAACAK